MMAYNAYARRNRFSRNPPSRQSPYSPSIQYSAALRLRTGTTSSVVSVSRASSLNSFASVSMLLMAVSEFASGCVPKPMV